jgi:uncharacterized protein (TIGR03067 family)
MTIRAVAALLVLLSLTAFAPAPLPRRLREPEPEITLTAFAGKWRLVRPPQWSSGGEYVPLWTAVTGLSISEGRLTFLVGRQDSRSVRLGLDPSTRPARLTFYDPQNGEVVAAGLLRRHGGGVQMLYRWGGEGGRPGRFDPPPNENQAILFTLEPERGGD